MNSTLLFTKDIPKAVAAQFKKEKATYSKVGIAVDRALGLREPFCRARRPDATARFWSRAGGRSRPTLRVWHVRAGSALVAHS